MSIHSEIGLAFGAGLLNFFLLLYIIIRLEKFMATQGQGLTDLQNQQAAILSAITGISASIGTVITDLQAVLAQLANPPAGDSDAAVEAVAQQLQANVATLTTLKANLDSAAAAVPPPPATT